MSSAPLPIPSRAPWGLAPQKHRGRQGLPPRPPDPRGRMEPGARGARGTRPRSRSGGRRSRASECLQQAASGAKFSCHAFFTASQPLLQGWPGPTCGDKARAAPVLVRKAGSRAVPQELAVPRGQIGVGWPCPGYRAAPCPLIGSFHLLKVGPWGKHHQGNRCRATGLGISSSPGASAASSKMPATHHKWLGESTESPPWGSIPQAGGLRG